MEHVVPAALDLDAIKASGANSDAVSRLLLQEHARREHAELMTLLGEKEG